MFGQDTRYSNACAEREDEFTGTSDALRHVLELIDTVARTDSTVLIRGETGTGKELVARAIHRRSARNGSFVKMSCAAVPSNLLESELFGHEKGAFTGAMSRRIGRFELAQDGTLFLDEVGELPLELQPKLLRVLQEREFERVGDCTTLQTNARLVAATHRDLGAMVDAKAFRQDLFYRLDVFPIRMPALRDRRSDIPLLARELTEQIAQRLDRPAPAISVETLAKLQAYNWPGNIRELQNVIERAVIRAVGPELVIEIPSDQLRRRRAVAPTSDIETLDKIECAHILAVLTRTNWVIGGPNGAAVRLGMKRTTLNARIKKLGIVRPKSTAVARDS